MRQMEFTVPEAFEGKKIYNFLRGYVRLSTRLMRSLKRSENGIMLQGKQGRTIDIIHTGDKIVLNIPDDEKAPVPIDYPLDVVYEDEDLLVINKPPTLAMHESHNHQGDTLANAVAGYLQKKGRSSTFRAVGRLDKGTSGLVICALNPHAAARLQGNFQKQYLAIAKGVYTCPGTIDKPIFRPDPIKTLRVVDPKGDTAVTHYEPLEYGKGYSLLLIRLETGRTHQIRVHFSSMGTPLFGDSLYGETDDRISHHALHCGEVAFIHPVTGAEIKLEAEMPKDMADLLQSLRSGF